MENKSFLEKALVKAEKAMKATPEYKDYDAAYEARKKACRAANEAKEAYDKACENLYGKDEALGEAEKAMHATPGYKAYDKAYEVYRKTFMVREFKKLKEKNNVGNNNKLWGIDLSSSCS